jgi:3,4-dihydroxy 2-butanone 4-phosphate synthase/GTP cyclohydrolase II
MYQIDNSRQNGKEDEPAVSVIRKVATRLPTEDGLFTLFYYENNLDNKEHMALVMGDLSQGEISQKENILLRLHSECFTGDVLSSRRCDCGHQLKQAMHVIAQKGQGIILYLRQEGRGIGLLHKLYAYNLQDEGLDTVEANLKLGHKIDERDYRIAVAMLKDLGVKSVQLLTNNPHKLKSLKDSGINVNKRVPIEGPIHNDNFHYLYTKKQKMKHYLKIPHFHKHAPSPTPQALNILTGQQRENRPLTITVSYAQSLDGSIASTVNTSDKNSPLILSSPASQKMTHTLRAQHDAILVGIGTVIADDPHLTVRFVTGKHPQPVILDTWLRLPLAANLFRHPTHKPMVFCSQTADCHKKKLLEKAGALILPIGLDTNGLLSLDEVFAHLKIYGLNRLMVEGGSKVITSFLTTHSVDQIIITLVPQLIGGLKVLDNPFTGNFTGSSDRQLSSFLPRSLPKLKKIKYKKSGPDIIIKAIFERPPV